MKGKGHRKKGPKGPIKEKARQRATLAPEGTTIAVTVLNFCVRDGNRCAHRAIVTRLFLERLNCSLKTGYCSTCPTIVFYLINAHDLAYSSIGFIELVKLSSRAISNGQLNTLLCLHFRPINLLTLEGSYSFRLGSLIFR